MVLYMIGIGLDSEKDITLKGLEAVKRCNKVYLEHYTSLLNVSKEKLEELYEKKIIIAPRDMVESEAENTILDDAKNIDVAFLVVGDVFGATTHTDLMLRAKNLGIEVKIINNASILNAVGVTGLELYKFGKTTSIVFPDGNWMPETPYDVIKGNQTLGLHTLCLLDIKVAEPSPENIKKGINKPQDPRFMTVVEGIDYLLKIEQKRKENIFTNGTIVIGCARIGSDDFKIITGTAKELLKKKFGKPLHCLIVPGKIHFIEQESIELYTK